MAAFVGVKKGIPVQTQSEQIPYIADSRYAPLLSSRRRSVALITILGILLVVSADRPLLAQQESATPARRVKAYKLGRPPVFDGRVDEDWMAFEPASGFIQQLPLEGQPASEQTEVRVGYTGDTLYFAVICYDSEPEKIVSTQGRRDGPLEETDAFEIVLDTYNDKQNGYIFATTAAGTEYDAQIVHAGQGRISGGSPRVGSPSSSTGGGSGRAGAQRTGSPSVNVNWDGVWKIKTQISQRGWEAEFAIPFRTLRFRSGDDQVWGVNFKRNLRRKNEQSYWSPVPRAFDLERVSLAGEVRGVNEIGRAHV